MAKSREQPKVVNKDSSVLQLEFKCKERDDAFLEFVEAHKIYNIHKQKMIRTGDKSDASRAKCIELKKQMQRLDHRYKAFQSEYEEMLKGHEDE